MCIRDSLKACLSALGLKERAVVDDWSLMRAPPLEMFEWKRLIIDEFTYIEKQTREHYVITKGVQATCRWALSGTPPISDFSDTKIIADFLSFNLGREEYASTCAKGMRSLDWELTKSEIFRSLMETPSDAWRKRRHDVAQCFLSRFVRQNIAEVDEIASEEQQVDIQLGPAEWLTYLELDSTLHALEARTSRKSLRAYNSGFEERLQSALGCAKSPEEALLRCCCIFTGKVSSETTLAALSTRRASSVKECQRSIEEGLVEAWVFQARVRQHIHGWTCAHLARWEKEHEKGSSHNACGDDEVADILKNLLLSMRTHTLPRTTPLLSEKWAEYTTLLKEKK